MARSAEPTTEANVSATGTDITTAAAAGDLDSVGEGAAVPAAESRLIKQVELLLRESGTTEPFDAAAWVERWLRRPNHALGGAAPELYLHTPQGKALLSNLIAPGDTQPLSPAQPPMRLLRWQARTQVFHEELGGAARLTMVRIPAGSFQMGSAEQEPGRHANEGPVHEVTLAEFLIGQTPITQAQWRAVASWEPQKGERWGRELNPEPAKFQGEEARLLAGETNTDGRPVERVSWLDASEFCSRLSQRTRRNYSLPSEAQWEYVCRAGTSTAHYFGDIIYSDLANFRGTDASRFSSPAPDPQPLFREQTTPVGMFPANAWGLHDMHGNVSEWCLDSVHSSYEGGPYDGSAWEDPQAPNIEQRITRGGSWSMPPRCCRSAFRFPYRSPSQADVPDGLYDDVGFRLVCLPKSVSGQTSNPQELVRGFDATVLWVDDNHDNNRSERSELEKLGIKVLQAGSTEEALAVLLSQPIDAIISDMSRHGRPRAGLEMLQQIKARGRSIPVVFYMGVKRPELEAEAMELGAAAVINQRDQLYVVVKSILSKR